jgi:hypothetical protein
MKCGAGQSMVVGAHMGASEGAGVVRWQGLHPEGRARLAAPVAGRRRGTHAHKGKGDTLFRAAHSSLQSSKGGWGGPRHAGTCAACRATAGGCCGQGPTWRSTRGRGLQGRSGCAVGPGPGHQGNRAPRGACTCGHEARSGGVARVFSLDRREVLGTPVNTGLTAPFSKKLNRSAL